MRRYTGSDVQPRQAFGREILNSTRSAAEDEMAAPGAAFAGQPGRRPGHRHAAADPGNRPQAADATVRAALYGHAFNPASGDPARWIRLPPARWPGWSGFRCRSVSSATLRSSGQPWTGCARGWTARPRRRPPRKATVSAAQTSLSGSSCDFGERPDPAHARVLLFVAHDPGVRPRDIAASLDITERSAFGIITDLGRSQLRGQGERRPPQPLPHPGAPPAARAHSLVTYSWRGTWPCSPAWTRPRPETCQSLVSLAKGERIRTLREPKSTITASSSSTRTTQPRPYLSWVTRSRTANCSTGGSAGRALNGLPGRKRRDAARAGFITTSMRPLVTAAHARRPGCGAPGQTAGRIGTRGDGWWSLAFVRAFTTARSAE